MAIRILIADDHGVVRHGLKMYLGLSDEFEVVGEARNGAEAVELAKELRPDVVIMDLSMPVMDGIAATRNIGRVAPASRVLALTSSTEAESVLGVIRAGAMGYVLKDADTDELVRALRATAAGQAELAPDVAGLLIREIQHLKQVEETSIRVMLFTDLEGHSTMMSRLGDERGRAVVRDYERLTDGALRAYGGREVKALGDGVMAWFGSAAAALECGLTLQREVARFVEGGGEPLRVRVGVNAGEPIEEEEDLFGAAVVMASRLADAAHGGQILVSDVVKGLVAGKGYQFVSRGEMEFRGFEDDVPVWQLISGGRG
ncbi:MAG: response regulator [Dehalococcoidia bacterium]